MDLKFIGLCPQGFESPRCRLLPHGVMLSERERLKTTAADGGKGKGKTKNRKLLEEKGRDNKRRLAREEKQ